MFSVSRWSCIVSSRMTYYIETFGCQMNQRDSETISGLLDSMGMIERESKTADVVIFNTCSVRKTAEDKVWSRIGKVVASRKKDLPLMVLSGCMAQLPANIKGERTFALCKTCQVGPNT